MEGGIAVAVTVVGSWTSCSLAFDGTGSATMEGACSFSYGQGRTPLLPCGSAVSMHGSIAALLLLGLALAAARLCFLYC